MRTEEQPEPRLIRRPEVERRTGLSRSTLYWLVSRGEFPRPVPLGRRTVGWVEAEVFEWLAQRIAVRDGRVAA